MLRRMPWMPTGPTRNHHRRRGGDEAGPPIEHSAVAIDHDQADLQHVMTA